LKGLFVFRSEQLLCEQNVGVGLRDFFEDLLAGALNFGDFEIEQLVHGVVTQAVLFWDVRVDDLAQFCVEGR